MVQAPVLFFEISMRLYVRNMSVHVGHSYIRTLRGTSWDSRRREHFGVEERELPPEGRYLNIKLHLRVHKMCLLPAPPPPRAVSFAQLLCERLKKLDEFGSKTPWRIGRGLCE